MGNISIFLRASKIAWLGIDGHTFDMTNLLAGFNNLRIGIVWSLIFIDWVVCIKLSSICLLDKKTQKRLFEILEMNIMFFGETILPIAKMYSFCGIPSIELKTKACSRLGVFSIATADAKFILLCVVFDDEFIV